MEQPVGVIPKLEKVRELIDKRQLNEATTLLDETIKELDEIVSESLEIHS